MPGGGRARVSQGTDLTEFVGLAGVAVDAGIHLTDTTGPARTRTRTGDAPPPGEEAGYIRVAR